MLRLVLPEQEFFDETNNVFIKTPGEEIDLEHSLLSLSKWESEFHKPFLSSDEKSDAEILRYIELMIVSGKVPEAIGARLTAEQYSQINDYINSPHSATTFNDRQQTKSRAEVVTSELIYFWLSSFSIPFTCETWHLNRLFSLIKIASIKNEPPKKMSQAELAQKHRELNEQRRKQLGTSG